jgi:hypothetical protein
MRPRRKFWQVHLSTLLLTQIAIGLFFLLNIYPMKVPETDVRSGGRAGMFLVYRGWPCEYRDEPRAYSTGEGLPTDKAIGVNVLVAAVATSLVFFLTEGINRRRARRNPPS